MEKYNLVKELILDRIGEKGIVNMIYDYILPLDNKKLLMKECLDIIKEFSSLNHRKCGSYNCQLKFTSRYHILRACYFYDWYTDGSLDKIIITKNNAYINNRIYKPLPLQIFDNVLDNIHESKIYHKNWDLLN